VLVALKAYFLRNLEEGACDTYELMPEGEFVGLLDQRICVLETPSRRPSFFHKHILGGVDVYVKSFQQLLTFLAAASEWSWHMQVRIH